MIENSVYAGAQEEYERRYVTLTPEMEAKERETAEDAIMAPAHWELGSECNEALAYLVAAVICKQDDAAIARFAKAFTEAAIERAIRL